MSDTIAEENATAAAMPSGQNLTGFLDVVVSSGYLEGWAIDLNAPDAPLMVAVLKDKAEVAWGYANRYREDLANAGFGTGWCAFRLRSSLPPGQLRNANLVLIDRKTGQEVHRPPKITLALDSDAAIQTVAALLADDPTIIRDLNQLRGCEALFQRFIAAHGPEQFVATAYGYVLQRPADDEGLAIYTGHLTNGRLNGFQTLAALAESAEYLNRKPQLSAPSAASFAFLV